MNNVEAFHDFLKLLKEVHPNVMVNQRDEMLLGMAINHAYILKSEEIKELKKELDTYKEIAESCECNN